MKLQKSCIGESQKYLTKNVLRCLYNKSQKIGIDEWGFNFSFEINDKCIDDYGLNEGSDKCFEKIISDDGVKNSFKKSISLIDDVTSGKEIYRGMRIDNVLHDKIYNGNGLSLGTSWSVNRESAQKFANQYKEGLIPIILSATLAKNDKKYVDVDQTVMTNLFFNENEVRLKKKAPLNIQYYSYIQHHFA